jgi:CarD family transcriptional regulator
MRFEIGSKAVVPNLGVGIVTKIDSLSIEDISYDVYVIKILDDGSTYLSPVSNTGENGVRQVIPPEAVNKVYEVLADRITPTDKQTWNRRYREYLNRIKSGDLLEIATVLRDLSLLRAQKTLSFGERKMYDQALSLITQELAVALDVHESEIQKKIEKIFEKDMEKLQAVRVTSNKDDDDDDEKVAEKAAEKAAEKVEEKAAEKVEAAES